MDYTIEGRGEWAILTETATGRTAICRWQTGPGVFAVQAIDWFDDWLTADGMVWTLQQAGIGPDHYTKVSDDEEEELPAITAQPQ